MVSKFLLLKCKKCNNEQITFEKPAMVVKCNVCEQVLVIPTGGRGKVKTKILSVFR